MCTLVFLFLLICYRVKANYIDYFNYSAINVSIVQFSWDNILIFQLSLVFQAVIPLNAEIIYALTHVNINWLHTNLCRCSCTVFRGVPGYWNGFLLNCEHYKESKMHNNKKLLLNTKILITTSNIFSLFV